jgi:hypothetical protein
VAPAAFRPVNSANACEVLAVRCKGVGRMRVPGAQPASDGIVTRITHSARLQPLSRGCDSGSRLARTRVSRVAPWGAVQQPPKWWYARIWPSRAADGQSVACVPAGADSANPVVRSRLVGSRVRHHLLGEPGGVDLDMALSMHGVGGAFILRLSLQPWIFAR